jgi:hypothetical protein
MARLPSLSTRMSTRINFDPFDLVPSGGSSNFGSSWTHRSGLTTSQPSGKLGVIAWIVSGSTHPIVPAAFWTLAAIKANVKATHRAGFVNPSPADVKLEIVSFARSKRLRRQLMR